MKHLIILRIGLLATWFIFGMIPVFAQGKVPLNFSLQVNGQVRYAASRTPAENVLVRIESFSGGLVGQVTTDRTGKFSFTGLNPTQYIVTIHAPGYVDVRENVNLVTANTDYLNVQLVEDKSSLANNNRNNNLLLGTGVIDANIPLEAQNEYTKGKTLLDTGKKEKVTSALEHLEKAVAIYPKFLEAQLLLGFGYMDLQQWEKAEKSLRAAIEINSNASTAYFAIGEMYRQKKKFPEAEKVLLDGIKVNEKSAEGHSTLAKVYWEMASLEKNEEQLKKTLENSWQEVNKSLKLNPNLAEAHLLAGNLLLRAHRAKDALTHFEMYLKLSPKGEFAPQTQSVVQKIKQALAQTEKNN